jgi:oxygen-independent coproporphyrinogen-3 oxidase
MDYYIYFSNPKDSFVLFGCFLLKREPVVRHVYLHIPFCTHICPYCAFAKTRNLTADIEIYFQGLEKEIEWAKRCFSVEPVTTFWGGGTPTALGLKRLEELLAGWPWSWGEEFTVEANPMTISERKAELLVRSGVNRVSLGVQAFDNSTLKTLGRTHDAAGVQKTISTLRAAGIENINIDLIFNVPGQTRAQWTDSLEAAMALEPEHISTYSLTYELDTEFFERLQKGEWKDDEVKGSEFYLLAMDRLEAGGWRQYEISNFSRPGKEARHNGAIWQGQDYLGLGTGAVSTIAGKRWKNPHGVAAYEQVDFENRLISGTLEVVDAAIQGKEKLMMGLRTREGIDPTAYTIDASRAQDLIAEGYLEMNGRRLWLTRRGRTVADEVIGELL